MSRHETDQVSLAFGVLFLAAVAWWLVVRSFEIDLPPAGWFLAAAMLTAGVLGLVAALRPHRR
jgi:hypothetical protein